MKRWLRRLGRRRAAERPFPPPGVTIGRATYGLRPRSFFNPSERAPVEIGAFCSFGPDVLILCDSEHVMGIVPTFPLRTRLLHPEAPNREAHAKGPIRIGHDVWVGARAIVLGGVTIGSGSIVGAGAVVASDVLPYSVVAGNPARVIRRRFDDATIDALLAAAWWEWPDERIRALEGQLYGDAAGLLAALGSGS